MATIKSYTDLFQSKVLAKILSMESTDMSWVSCDDGRKKYYKAENRKIILNYEKNHWLPCWSLSALLGVLPKGYSLGRRINGKYYVCMTNIKHNISEFDNPIDACYEMIIRLNELKML